MFFNFSLTAARKGYSAFGAKSRTYTTPPSNFSNPMMANVESNIAKQLQTMPKIKSGDIPNFIPTEIGDQNESPHCKIAKGMILYCSDESEPSWLEP